MMAPYILKHYFYIFLFIIFCTNTQAAVLVNFESNQGNFTVELYPEKAPITVKNFLQYAENGFYKNTIFHRVIRKFMIQGGGYEVDLFEKPTLAPIKNEANNGLLNKKGTIAMARTKDPDSANAQFFINLSDNAFLNYAGPSPNKIGYCVFGKITKGMDIVEKIGSAQTGNIGGFANVPLSPIIIKNVVVIKREAAINSQ